MKITLATRRSALALSQSRAVATALIAANPGLEVIELQVVTEGDRVTDRPLAAIGGKGLFVKEIEQAVCEGRADLAVHSMKDLPVELAPGLCLAAVPERESPYDLLIGREPTELRALRHGAHVGTSSRRRELQLLALRPDLVISPLRGNIDTRLSRLGEGRYDAIVLAAAGVSRLGLKTQGVSLEGLVVPAIAQGALALETRADDQETIRVVRALHHRPTALETTAERAVLRALGGSCTVPLGALARWNVTDDTLSLQGYLARDEARSVGVTAMTVGPVSDFQTAEALGIALAASLRNRLDTTP